MSFDSDVYNNKFGIKIKSMAVHFDYKDTQKKSITFVI